MKDPYKYGKLHYSAVFFTKITLQKQYCGCLGKGWTFLYITLEQMGIETFMETWN